jgi:hypothetical protein
LDNKTIREHPELGMTDADNDVAEMLQQFLEDLSIYESGSLFEKSPPRPSREDLANVETETALRALGILRRYVRPRSEVLKIRRAVNAAFQSGQVESGTIYSRHLELQQELDGLKDEKSELEMKLRAIRGRPAANNDAQNILVGKMLLEKSQNKTKTLQIYLHHLKLLLPTYEEVDNQTTLVNSSFW